MVNLFHRIKKTRGFTVLELLVTVAIMATVSGVVIANYPKLNSQLTLQLVANDVALSIRQAQQYALGALQRGQGPGSVLITTYGIHFDITGGNNRTYKLFVDNSVPKNYAYDAGTDTEVGSGTIQNNKIFIVRLCGIIASQGQAPLMSCIANGVDKSAFLDKVDIVFEKPNPDMRSTGTSSGFGASPGGYSEVAIVFQNDHGTTKTARVTLAGQISVQ
jgi:prepilin-type N-terminal cleavage/methylation domain-containing protein